MVRVQTERFEPGALQDQLAGNSAVGAVVTFTGYVRQTDTLELEHYPGMTEAVMADLRQQAIERFALEGAIIVHRVGPLSTGEPIVWVGTSAPHRGDAFKGAM
ncbi:MAG: molybdenum cofactor biosynthesis protein MoaE, partial [Litorivicinus sp.]